MVTYCTSESYLGEGIKRLGLLAAGARDQIHQVPSPESGHLEWTSKRHQVELSGWIRWWGRFSHAAA